MGSCNHMRESFWLARGLYQAYLGRLHPFQELWAPPTNRVMGGKDSSL